MAGAPEPSEVAQHSGTAVCSRRSMQWHLKVEDLNKLANLSQTDDEASHCDATRLIVPACRPQKTSTVPHSQRVGSFWPAWRLTTIATARLYSVIR